MKGKTPKDVDEYISWQSEEFRKNLIECRNYIRDLVPEAEEMISYQIPTYKLYYMLVGFGVTKKYCSFYTMSPDLIKRMEKDLKNIKAKDLMKNIMSSLIESSSNIRRNSP